MLHASKCLSRVLTGTPARRAILGGLARPLTAAPLPHHRAAFSVAAVTSQARFCSSSSSAGTHATTPAAAPPAPVKPQGDAEDAALTAEEQAAADSIISRIQGLSPEDQQLILNALQNPTSQKSSVMGGGGIGPAAGEMVAAFTCGRCEFRMVKRFSKHAYTKGIVIVECPDCRVKHLIADNLGWIEDEARNIEDILREKGESFVRVGDGDYQVIIDSDPATEIEPKQ